MCIIHKKWSAVKHAFWTLCWFTSSYDMCNNVEVSLQVFTAQVLQRNGKPREMSVHSWNNRVSVISRRGEGRHREESTQTINLLWILWSSIFVQFHHELLTAKEAGAQLQSVNHSVPPSTMTACRHAWAFACTWHSACRRSTRDCYLFRFLLVPDLFGLTSVIQREKDVCILADTVVSKALQIDEEMVRHGDTATVTMALSHAVTLGTKKKMTANKTGPYCERGQVPAILYIDKLI